MEDLTAAQVQALSAALSDAIAYRWPDGFCADCESLPEGSECDDHIYDRGLAEKYVDVAGQLGIPVEALPAERYRARPLSCPDR